MKKKQFWTKMADARPPINRLCVFAWRWESGLMHYECGILKDEATPDGVEYWAVIPELDEENTVAPPKKNGLLTFLKSHF